MPAGTRHFLFGSLRRQLILGVALVHAAMMALFVWDLTERQRAMLLDRQSEHATALARSIATSAAGWLAARDYYGLREIVEAQSRYPELVYAMILDPQGRILAHTDPTRVGQYLTDLPGQPWQAGQDVTHILHRRADLVDVAAHAVLAGRDVGWVRVGLGQEITRARLQALTRDGAIYALAAILLGSVLAALMGHRLTHRLRAIQAVADHIEAGGAARRVEIEGDDEAARLAAAFNAMLDALARREAELRTSEQRLSMAVAASGLGIWDMDLQTGRASHSPGMSAMLDHTPEELPPTYEAWLAILHPDDRPRLLAAVEACRRDPNADYRVAIRLQAANGDWRWIESRGRVIGHDDQGGLHMAGTHLDITERIETEARLSHHKEELEAEVAQRTAELIQARDAAEAANRAKSQFLATMSHELRTPLNAILGFAQLLRRDATLTEVQRRQLDTINRSGRHLLELINEVLEISRIEAGRIEPHETDFDLPALLGSVTETLAGRARAQGLELETILDPDLPRWLRADAGKLREVLTNLLTNAVKYTPHGRVEVRVWRLSGAQPEDASIQVAFEVADTGLGIEPEAIEHLFQPFFQSRSGRELGEGAGLGLAIGWRYVQCLGGALTVESTPGQGTRFRFALPMRLAPPGPAAAPARTLGVLAADQPGARILVVDDQADNRELIVAALEQAGFQTRAAGNGQEALAEFQDWRPDLVLMDMRMPVMDGYAATRALRALPEGASVPVVALTATAFAEDRAAILAAGCTEVVIKPVDLDQLFDTLGRCLGVHFEPAEAAVTPAPGPAVDLARLPGPVRARLTEAAVALDKDILLATIASLHPEHPAEAACLAGLVEDYQFDRIEALVRPPANLGDPP